METNSQTNSKRRRISGGSNSITTKSFQTNLKLSEEFKTLGNLHQECPLLPTDMWKGYCFRIVAGRLKHLDFEISIHTLDRLKGVKGIGASCLDKIREYLEQDLDHLSRITEFQKDPQRIAMKNMMDIWGVGRIKVRLCVYVFVLFSSSSFLWKKLILLRWSLSFLVCSIILSIPK